MSLSEVRSLRLMELIIKQLDSPFNVPKKSLASNQRAPLMDRQHLQIETGHSRP